MMVMPLGLLNSLAILASSRLGATPMEQVRPVASAMLFWISRASTRPPSRWPPGTSVKSMYTSSTPRSCITGAISVMTLLNRREYLRTSSKSTGSTMACRHSLPPLIIPPPPPPPHGPGPAHPPPRGERGARAAPSHPGFAAAARPPCAARRQSPRAGPRAAGSAAVPPRRKTHPCPDAQCGASARRRRRGRGRPGCLAQSQPFMLPYRGDAGPDEVLRSMGPDGRASSLPYLCLISFWHPTDMRGDDAPTSVRAHPGLHLAADPIGIVGGELGADRGIVAAEGGDDRVLQTARGMPRRAGLTVLAYRFTAEQDFRHAVAHCLRGVPEPAIERRHIVDEQGVLIVGKGLFDLRHDLRQIDWHHADSPAVSLKAACSSASGAFQPMMPPCAVSIAKVARWNARK